jgi:hypothetical protein
MPASRRFWRWIAGTLVLLVAVAAALPFLLRGPIEARVKRELAARLTARVEWRRVDLGLLRTFPNLSLGLDGLTVVGTGAFVSDTLLAVPRFHLVLDAPSVFRCLMRGAPVLVRSVELERPAAKLLVLPDGTANWDILIQADSARQAPGRGLDLRVQRFAITGGAIVLDNRQSGLAATLRGLRHTLRGDFRQQQFTIETRAVVDSASLRFAGVPYLSGVRLELDTEIAADLAAKQFTIRRNSIQFNELQLAGRGQVEVSGGNLVVDLAFDAPAAEFRDVLSLVPAMYAGSFQSLQASGTVAVNGWVRGSWGPDSFPSLAVRARVENGGFRYPDLPLPARDIHFDLAIANPGGHVDSTVVRLDRFHLVLGSDAVDGSFVMRNPVSDPEIGFRLNGRIDLANVGRTVKLERVQELSGVVVANASMRARLSDVEGRRYERVTAAGTVEVSGLAVAGANLRQPLHIERAVLRLTPRTAELRELRGRVGSSDLQLAGSLDNLLGFALRDQPLRGQANLRSAHFDLNEWRSDDELKSVMVPASLDLALEAAADTVVFGELTLRNARGTVRVKDGRASLDDFSLDLLGGALLASGWYDTSNPARPAFDVDLGLTGLDIPSAFSGLRTVQAFAPVARYAQGRVSAQLGLTGALGADMLPLFGALSGDGELTTSGLVLRAFPALDRLAELLKLPLLQDPGFVDLRSSIEIRDGRLFVKPFDVRTGPLAMTVSGSHGIDQSLDYDIALHLPRALLGGEANRAVSNIVARSARAGFDIQAADVITLGVGLQGTITSPRLTTSFRDAASGAAGTVEQALREEAERRVDTVRARLDTAAANARRRAAEEAARIMSAAEEQAAAVRAAAKSLAERARAAAYERADSLEARATGAVARVAAKAAADRIRREADARAAAAVREADTRAGAIMAEARKRAGLPPDTAGARF